MTQEPPSADVDLQLEQRLIEITKIIEQNSIKIKEILKEQEQDKNKIEEWNSKLQEREMNLEDRFNDIKQNLTNFNERIGGFIQKTNNNNEEIRQRIQELLTNQSKVNEELKSMIQEQQTNQNQVNEELKSMIQEQKTNQSQVNEEIKTLIQNKQENQAQINNQHKIEIDARVTEENFFSNIDELKGNFDKKSISLEQTLSQLDNRFNEHSNMTQNHFTSIAKTIEMLGEGLENLDKFGGIQETQLEELRESFNQFKQKLKEVISLSKEDQRSHFENFSRIIESYNENIRTEIALTAQSLKESDTKILDEASTSFMARKKGEELEKMLTNFIEELKSEATKTREELVQGLKESVEEYEKTMELQNTRIQNYQNEFKDFQSEIQAVIDRKVNEKYEVVFSLLSKVAIQTEELALLLKTSEIQILSSALKHDEMSSPASQNEDQNHIDSGNNKNNSRESINDDND
ncbi:MAG: hypothetical protein ACFFAU_07070 [Candidatus Hodarchaeota archaeon]